MQIVPFLLVAVVLVATPGLDTALVTRTTLAHGRAAGILAALGVNAGIVVWSLATALGLAALVVASARVFAVVELLGAAYVISLGVRALLASRRGAAGGAPAPPPRPLSRAAAFRQGLVCNLLNPKIALLFMSLLPPFAGRDPSTAALLLLGAIYCALGATWLVGYALLVARGRSVLERPRVRRLVDAASGVVLIGLGLRIALARR